MFNGGQIFLYRYIYCNVSNKLLMAVIKTLGCKKAWLNTETIEIQKIIVVRVTAGCHLGKLKDLVKKGRIRLEQAYGFVSAVFCALSSILIKSAGSFWIALIRFRIERFWLSRIVSPKRTSLQLIWKFRFSLSKNFQYRLNCVRDFLELNSNDNSS